MSSMVEYGSTALPPEMLERLQTASILHGYKHLRMAKNPFDLALYPLLLWQVRPRSLIEIGSFKGGSAVWFSDQGAALGLDMQVHSFDIAQVTDVKHPNVTFHAGNARDPKTAFPLDWIASLPRPLIVIDDADHFYETTKAILDHFAPLMRNGEYIVVEDGIVTPLGVADEYDGGPIRAIAEFVPANTARFEIDRRYCDRFGHNVTWNIDGYLKCIA